jgi:hypothetical protein
MIDKAEDFSGVWEVVKDTVKDYSGEYRGGMLLFLDDLPLRLGAYHPLGTNNIVLNRTLIHTIEAAGKPKGFVNAFIYNLLAHEYLHALGHIPEAEVRSAVYDISRASFGEEHPVTRLAEKSPWALLRDIPLNLIAPKRQAMEVVRDFEKESHGYIV